MAKAETRAISLLGY